jgi:hypothetical protein
MIEAVAKLKMGFDSVSIRTGEGKDGQLLQSLATLSPM